MLRYYEQIGLIECLRKDDSNYRVYDDATVQKIRQIIILRKLRVPVRQIIEILNNHNAAVAVDILQQNINQLGDEIATLTKVKSILSQFVDKLQSTAQIQLELDFASDESVLFALESVSFTNNQLKENYTMADLKKVEKKLEQRDVRIIYLPSMTVASAHYVGKDCEMHSHQMLERFVKEKGLLTVKPDLRWFSFDNSEKQHDSYGTPSYGYEMWVTIPDDMEVSEPIRKIKFHGGLYAAHCIHNFEFDHWKLLTDWIRASELYESDWGSIRCAPHMDTQEWAIEETLNIYTRLLGNDHGHHQLDLLFPIKQKERG